MTKALMMQRWVNTQPTPPEGPDTTLTLGLRAIGLDIYALPLIETQPVAFKLPEDWPERYDWLVFTSQNAVQGFFQGLGHLKPCKNWPKLAVVGPATAQILKTFSLRADFMPTIYQGQALAEALCRQHKPKRVLWPCNAMANPDVLAAFKAHGVICEQVFVYETRLRQTLPDDFLAWQKQGPVEKPIDGWIFTSPSAVQAANELHLPTHEGIIACLGPKTAQAAIACFGRCDILPTAQTMSALLEAVVRCQ